MVILYAEFGKPDFQRLHEIISSKVYEGLATYVLRHYLAVGVSHTLLTRLTLKFKFEIMANLPPNVYANYSYPWF